MIEASVRFAAYAKDEKLIAWKKRLVEETIQAQEPDGYFGMMAGADRVTRLWDASESGYLILGLLTDYQYLGEKRSLEAARKLADYLVRRWSGPPAKWPKVSLINSSIGLEYAMLLLYRETGDRRYLDFCVQKRSLQDWAAGLAVGPRSPIREHAYGYVGNCLAQLELHRVQPSDRLLQPTRQAIAFLTAQDYATITGEAGRDEHLIDDQDVRGPVGETCATVYLIRFYNHLLQMTGDSRFGDLMERTIYNALFAAQSPDGRRLRYFVPLEGPREYFRVNRYCCPNNYRRGVSELPTLICYRSGAGAAVNLYAPSEAAIDLSGGVSLKVRPGDRLSHLRSRRHPTRSVETGQVPATIAHSTLVSEGLCGRQWAAMGQTGRLRRLPHLGSRVEGWRPGDARHADDLAVGARQQDAGGIRRRDARADGLLPEPNAERGDQIDAGRRLEGDQD